MAGTARARLLTAPPNSDARAALVAIAEIVADLEALRGAVGGAVITLANELKADFNLLRTDVNNLITLANELKTDYTALLADVTAIRTSVVGITAKLDLDAGVTDTNYAATQNPAALTATAIAAANATLTATAIAAADASATALDTASDLTAAKVVNLDGTAITL